MYYVIQKHRKLLNILYVLVCKKLKAQRLVQCNTVRTSKYVLKESHTSNLFHDAVHAVEPRGCVPVSSYCSYQGVWLIFR